MNKHLHRIVFNAARGLRMVVQETARSTGRGARKATGGGAGAGASSAALSVAAIAAALMSFPLHAQIVADPSAPGGQRPTVLAAPNGVPLVNIQTPSAAGVSRNTYSQFDVQRNGVVLNNSRGNAQTQLGGWVQGNPWLATGSARVILNEVNSANPSQLRGYPVRSIMGCQLLNCNASKTDPNYANSSFNSQYISGHQQGYDLGLGQLPTGKTYNQLVAGNIQNDPVGATVAGAGMIGLGYLVGGAGAATGVKLFGAGVGAGMNYFFQPSGQRTDWIDVGIAGGTGFLTSGVGPGSSVMINTGGSLLGSAIKGENPNAGMGAAAVGTLVGYGVGAGAQAGVGRVVDPQHWYRPQWIDVGTAMSRPNTPSAIPGMAGAVGSSFAQEPTGNTVKTNLQQRQGQ